MDGITGWLASSATIAGGLTVALNLGSRVTGWGFVLLTLGSACWSLNAMQNQNTSLLVANLTLAAVNAFGIWRWLGRRRMIEKGSAAATKQSAAASVPTLVSAASLLEAPVHLSGARPFGTVVDLMLRCGEQDLAYAVVAFDGIGGLGEELRTVPAEHLRLDPAGLHCDLAEALIRALPATDPAAWPAAPDLPGNQPG